MKRTHHILVHELVGSSQLVGASMGESHRPSFLTAVQADGRESLVRFDWSGVTLATGSYLRAAYIPVFQDPKNSIVISSDMATSVREELEIVLENRQLAILAATRIPRRKSYNIAVLGVLDDAYRDTISVIVERGTATATELFAEVANRIGKTGWMNRLSRLSDMGLLQKEKKGKEYQYSFPHMGELGNG